MSDKDRETGSSLRRGLHAALLTAAIATALNASLCPAFSEEQLKGWDRPMHGVAVDFPEGWSFEISEGETNHAIDATCNTPECERTQETCRIVVTNSEIPMRYVPGGWLVSMTLGGNDAREKLLKAGNEGATITREPGTLWLGKYSWYVGETLGAGKWKSLSQATSVIDGRFIKVWCRTCDHSQDRFAFAHKILASVRITP